MATRPASPIQAGAPASGYNPAYGGVPAVPSLVDIYGQTLGANQKFLPQFTNLGADITSANQSELLNNLRMSIPGYDASVAKSMSNIGALQSGQIPTDVLDQLLQAGAERGIATGISGSPASNAAVMRALGLTSLGLESQGETEMSNLLARTPQAKPFDISNLLMNPTDLYESNLLANMYASSPVPAAAAQRLQADQLAAYGMGKNNVPSYAGAGGPSLPSLAPTPLAPGGGNLYNAPNPAAVGALPDRIQPFVPSKPYSFAAGVPNVGEGMVPAGMAPGWQWDNTLGMFFNPQTGEVSDNPAAGYSTGLAEDFYTPATAAEASQTPEVAAAPTADEGDYYVPTMY